MIPKDPVASHRSITSPFVILSPVRVLFGVLVLCTLAMIWAAVATTRHILRHRRASRSHSEHHDEIL